MIKKKFLITLLTLALTLTTAIALTACGDDKTAVNDEDNDAAAPFYALEVNVDKELVCTYISYRDMYDAITVNLVSDSGKREVAYEIVEAKVSDDKDFVDVTVAAEGLQKTLQVPFEEFEEIEDVETVEFSQILPNVKISLPLVMPFNDTTITVEAIVHTSNIIFGTGKDYFTATVNYNGEKAIVDFVVRDNYVYANANELINLLYGDSIVYNAQYYRAFEIDGAPASIKDVILAMINGGNDYDDSGDQGGENEGDDEYEQDPRLQYGYGVQTKDCSGYIILGLNATEADLKAELSVYVYDEDDEQIDFDEYWIEGFDSSVQGTNEVRIYLTKHSFVDIEVIICDFDKVEATGEYEGSLLIEKDEQVSDVKDRVEIAVEYTDGTSIWSRLLSGFTIDKIVKTDGEDETEVKDFSERGDYALTVTHVDTSTTYTIYAHVYDPENLCVVDYDCNGAIYIENGASLDDIRNLLYFEEIYDNGERNEIYDYEIIGYEAGANSFTVKYNDFTTEVEVYYEEPYSPEEPENSFAITDYVRFMDQVDAERPILTALRAAVTLKNIIGDNKEWLSSLVTTSEVENGKQIRIAVNNDDNKDLFALINLFFGVKGEDGWEDIDEDTIINALSSIDSLPVGYMLNAIMDKMSGENLKTVLSDLYVTATVTIDGKISLIFSYENAEKEQYFSCGAEFELADAIEDFVLGNIDDALPLEQITTVIMATAMKILS